MIKKTLFVALGALTFLGFAAGCKSKEPVEEPVDTTAAVTPEVPICQSCAMPLTKPEDFGTEADGSPSKDYCIYCYADGKFTNPEMTMEQMIEFLAPKWGEWTKRPDLSAEDAKKEIEEVLKGLKRWKMPEVYTS
ncbi:zinc ribbon domain-containing protein [candidate division WOR-3 bacterium]|nr:zinc ribbon domain-containing protein [candidate division WOR-3 bacterium]